MTGYTSIFGGNTILPSDTSFSQINLASFVTLDWPGQGEGPFTSSIIEVNPLNAGYNITMPSALLVSPGETITFKNIGGYSFTVRDNGGGSIITIATGQAFTVYLRDNSTVAGAWSYWQAGAGNSTVDAAAIDGAGLDAAAGLLRVSMLTRNFASSQAFADADRGSMAVWTGGSGTFTVPSAGAVGSGWFMNFKNSGSGTLTIAASSGETFDGASSITLAAGQGATVSCNGTNFSFLSSVSSGSVSFTYLSISVAGTGTYTLNATEAANNALQFTGVLTGNRTVVVPNLAREYSIANATTGAFTLTVKTAAGTGVVVTQTKVATVFCDGTNVRASDNDFPAGLSTPISIANGGTGQTTAGAALTALGGTATGVSVFTAATAAAARSAIVAATTGANTFSGDQAITGNLSVTGTITGTTTAFPAGTKIVFAQTAAPTGWTKDLTHDNKALRVVTGTAGFGGSVAFTTAFTSRSISGSTDSVATSGTVGGTALSEAQIPFHRHTLVAATSGSGTLTGSNYLNRTYDGTTNLDYSLRGGGTDTSLGLSGGTGSGATHTHTFTGSSHSHVVSGSLDMTVQYVDTIIATKN